jgi:hypothetical protein
MLARSYALSLVAAASILLGVTVCANVVIDPQGVFGTGIISHRVTQNTRYLRFQSYRQDRPQIDGLLFASSRGGGIDRSVLAERMQVGKVADFSVPFGLMTDHLPALEYILRDKRTRGERVEAVLLMLDMDHFGKVPWTNANMDSFLPPELSGETSARFWWRYLTAFQYRSWRVGAYAAWRDRGPAGEATETRRPTAAGEPRSRRAAPRPDFQRQLALLGQFATLCREHGVRLDVATSPLSKAGAAALDARELEFIAAEISRAVPVWEFKASQDIATRDDLWLDRSHFNPALGTMMLERIYRDGRTDDPATFGRLRPQHH